MISLNRPFSQMALRLAPAVSLLLVLCAGASRPAFASSVRCQAYPGIPVALTDLGLPNYHVWGEWCATATERSVPDGTATVQLLLPGATYGHRYWDLSSAPIDGVSYSYARDEAARGYPTFALDRIGTGNSDHPVPSALVDVNTNATVVHQVVQGLKDGSITGISFGRVIEIGHSLGSFIALAEASKYHDVDGVIITGLLHHLNAATETLFSTNLYPAGQDPRFAGQSWASDPGYLTTLPPPNGDVESGVRGRVFYNTAVADPNVIAADEQSKETFTEGELDTSSSISPTASLQILVPVLLIYGTWDALLCDPTFDCANSQAVQQEEDSYYSPQACLQLFPVPNAGHDVSLHPNNSLQVNEALSWSDQFVGRSTSSQPPGCPHS
jgi:pimeloyl-ACP methyl ester carboxylesterase